MIKATANTGTPPCTPGRGGSNLGPRFNELKAPRLAKSVGLIIICVCVCVDGIEVKLFFLLLFKGNVLSSLDSTHLLPWLGNANKQEAGFLSSWLLQS